MESNNGTELKATTLLKMRVDANFPGVHKQRWKHVCASWKCFILSGIYTLGALWILRWFINNRDKRGEERREEGTDRKNWSSWLDVQAHTVTCSLACRWYQRSCVFGWITVCTNGPVTPSSTSLSYLTVARKQSSPSSQSHFLVIPRRWSWDWDNKIQRRRR